MYFDKLGQYYFIIINIIPATFWKLLKCTLYRYLQQVILRHFSILVENPVHDRLTPSVTLIKTPPVMLIKTTSVTLSLKSTPDAAIRAMTLIDISSLINIVIFHSLINQKEQFVYFRKGFVKNHKYLLNVDSSVCNF